MIITYAKRPILGKQRSNYAYVKSRRIGGFLIYLKGMYTERNKTERHTVRMNYALRCSKRDCLNNTVIVRQFK